MDGKWIGRGVSISAGSVFVEAGSRITATAQGYFGGDNRDGTGPGGGSGNSGATHAGMGTPGPGVCPVRTFTAIPRCPWIWGAAGAASMRWVRAAVAGRGTHSPHRRGHLDDQRRRVSADGQSMSTGRGDGGGSGGSILISAGMIQGTGQISADGGSSLSYRGGGGGGRVTIYPYRGMTLPPASITAGGGTGGHGTAQAGTISILESPYLAWNGGSTLLHGTTGLAWTALGINPSTTDVDISAYYGRPQGLVIAAGQPYQRELCLGHDDGARRRVPTPRRLPRFHRSHLRSVEPAGAGEQFRGLALGFDRHERNLVERPRECRGRHSHGGPRRDADD